MVEKIISERRHYIKKVLIYLLNYGFDTGSVIQPVNRIPELADSMVDRVILLIGADKRYNLHDNSDVVRVSFDMLSEGMIKPTDEMVKKVLREIS